MKIYYEDTHIIVCQKEAGLLSEGNEKDCMPYLLSQYLLSQSPQKSGEIFPVHRLDRETSGIMVYAKTKKAAAGLSKAIAEGRLQKEYIAKIHGTPDPLSGSMDDLLFYDRAKNRSFVVKRMRKGVKDARLEYTTLLTENGISTVRIRLLTGRTHQIRVQFASRKMPLLGDRRYGAPPNEDGLSLRACALTFEHPITGEQMEFENK